MERWPLWEDRNVDTHSSFFSEGNNFALTNTFVGAITPYMCKVVNTIKRPVYSCFEKGCPTKPYTTMPKDIMGNGGSWSLIETLDVSAT